MEKTYTPLLQEEQSSKPKPEAENDANNYRVTQPQVPEFFVVSSSLAQRRLTRAQREATEPQIVAIY